MTTEHNTSSAAPAECKPSGKTAACGQMLVDNQPVVDDPAALEQEHSRLMQLQGEQTNEDALIDEVRHFISRARNLGRRIEDPRTRQRWQGVLTYWSIYAYRTAHLDLDTELIAFDPSLGTSFTNDQYPYQFSADIGKARQETLAWRRLLDECERDLANDHLLTIIGEVGSGRKFLLFDLLLPMLRSGRARRPELADSANWRYIRVHIDKDPVRDLVRGVAEVEAHDEHWVTEQSRALCGDPTRLAAILESNGATATLIAFERFGSLLKAPADERAVLTRALAYLLKDSAKEYYLAVTLRPRHTCTLPMFGELEHLLQDGRVLVGLTTAELRHLIEEPAQQIGLVFEHGLIDQIMIDIQGETTSLPLLEFTLSRLWEHRERNRITWKAYHKVGAGTNALRSAMNAVYEPLSNDEKTAFRALILAMVCSEADSGFVSCEVPLTDLHRICGHRQVADKLVDLMRRQKLLHERVVNSAHLVALSNNTILTAWPPLVRWLDEQQVLHRFRTRLKEAAREWQGGRSEDVLWRGALLVGAESEFGGDTTLTTCEREFLEASRLRETRELRRRKRTRGAILLGVVGVLTAFPLALWHHEQQQNYSQNAFACLLGGDLPGAILWLNQRNSNIELPFLGRPSPDAKLRKFAEIQLPRVEVQAQKEDFHSVAVSDDGSYIATLVSPKPSELPSKAPISNAKYVVTATPTRAGKTHRFEGETPAVSVPAGCLAFFRHSSDSPLFLISGFGGALRCLRLNDTDAQLDELLTPKEHEGSQIVDLDVGAGLLAVTWLSQDDKYSLTLFEIAPNQEAGGLALRVKEIKNPEGLEGFDIRLAALSSCGDLVVVGGPESDQTKMLKAWRKTPGLNTWTLAPPPTWAFGLDAKDRQRLYDYGWTLTKSNSGGKSWQRDGSYVRSIAFSPSGLNFVTASDDGQVVLWSFSEANATNALQVAPKIETKMQLGSSTFDVAFLSDDVIATAGRDRTARIWNIHSGTEISPRMHHEGTVERVYFNTSSGALVTKTKHAYRVWQDSEYLSYRNLQYSVIADGGQITVAETEVPDDPRGAAGDVGQVMESNVVSTLFSRDRKWLCTIYKPEAQSTFSMLVCRQEAINQGVAVDHAITLHDLEAIPVVCFAADEKWLAVATKPLGSTEPHRICLWNLTSPLAAPTIAEVPSLVLTGSNNSFSDVSFNQLAIGYYKTTGVLALVGAQKLFGDKKEGVLCVGTFPVNSDAPQLKLALLSSSPDRAGDDRSALCTRFSPAADLLAVGSAENIVKVWEVADLIRSIKRAPGGTFAASPIDQLRHSSDVKSLAFSPGTNLLATVSSEGDASLWSLAGTRASKGKEKVGQPRTPDYKMRHDANILCISFSPGGEMAITGGLDRTARVWDITGAAKGRGAWDGPKLVGIFRHQNPVLDASIPRDDQVRTISGSLAKGENAQGNAFQERFWDASNLTTLSTAKLEELAARKVEGAELKELENSGLSYHREDPSTEN